MATIELDGRVLRRAQRIARTRGVPLQVVVEMAVRLFTAAADDDDAAAPKAAAAPDPPAKPTPAAPRAEARHEVQWDGRAGREGRALSTYFGDSQLRAFRSS